jgi:Tol biopolymer transport system component/DNA-binding winged helix-turn-helix (wHTH) protein
MLKQESQLFEFGEYHLDQLQGGLYCAGKHVPLTPKALTMLLFLVQNCHRVVGKEELLKAVWPDSFVEEGNLSVTIHHLRKALGGKGSDERFIQTLSRQGYRWVADTREVQEAPTPSRQNLSPDPPALQPVRSRGWVIVVIGVTLAGAAAGAGGLWLAHRPSATPSANEPLVRLTNNVADDLQPDVSPDGRQIVFVSNRDGGKGEIYVMDADGGNQRNLTHNPGNDSPAWSADGRRIAFQSARSGATYIYTMNADGSQVTRLTAGTRPAWSPDAKRLVYTCKLEGHNELCIAPASPSDSPQVLTHDHLFNADAAWSPDGSWIAFTSSKGNRLQIHAIHPDGTGRKVLAADASNNRLPVWSPDGRKIAFNSDRNGQPDSLYLMEADGTLQRRISDGKFAADEAAWLPDGRGLVFESYRDGNAEIYRMRLPADPDGAIRLTNNVASDGHPSWSPEGKWIAFESNREGQWGIYVMDQDGHQTHKLTRQPAVDSGPAWAPDGSKIAFSSDRGGKRGIFTMNTDGSGVQRLTEGSDTLPSWSGDSRFLCFERNGEVWLASPVSANPGDNPVRKIVAGDSCALSSDGKQILFHQEIDGVRELRRFDLDTGAITNLTNNGHGNGCPAWRRDGLHIAFNSNADGYAFGIFVMNANGSAQTRITGREALDGWPAWSPDGRWIAFDSGRDGNREIYKIAVP